MQSWDDQIRKPFLLGLNFFSWLGCSALSKKKAMFFGYNLTNNLTNMVVILINQSRSAVNEHKLFKMGVSRGLFSTNLYLSHNRY